MNGSDQREGDRLLNLRCVLFFAAVKRRVFLIPGIGLCLCACSSVMPWERGNLAKPQMAMQPFATQAEFREHIYGAREAATGGTAGNGGGGCGCY